MEAQLQIDVKAHLFVWHHGKIKEARINVNQDIRERSAELHKSGSSCGTVSRRLKGPRHLFKQLYASVNTVGMSSIVIIIIILSAQEGDGFCVPEMYVLRCKMSTSTPEQKTKKTF